MTTKPRYIIFFQRAPIGPYPNPDSLCWGYAVAPMFSMSDGTWAVDFAAHWPTFALPESERFQVAYPYINLLNP